MFSDPWPSCLVGANVQPLWKYLTSVFTSNVSVLFQLLTPLHPLSFCHLIFLQKLILSFPFYLFLLPGSNIQTNKYKFTSTLSSSAQPAASAMAFNYHPSSHQSRSHQYWTCRLFSLIGVTVFLPAAQQWGGGYAVIKSFKRESP